MSLEQSPSRERHPARSFGEDMIGCRPLDAARISGISRAKIYELMAAGKLANSKVAGCRIIHMGGPRGLRALIENGTVI